MMYSQSLKYSTRILFVSASIKGRRTFVGEIFKFRIILQHVPSVYGGFVLLVDSW